MCRSIRIKVYYVKDSRYSRQIPPHRKRILRISRKPHKQVPQEQQNAAHFCSSLDQLHPTYLKKYNQETVYMTLWESGTGFYCQVANVKGMTR